MMRLFDDFENVSVTNEWNFVNKEWTFLTILTTNFVVFLTERGASGSQNKLLMVSVFDTGTVQAITNEKLILYTCS